MTAVSPDPAQPAPEPSALWPSAAEISAAPATAPARRRSRSRSRIAAEDRGHDAADRERCADPALVVEDRHELCLVVPRRPRREVLTPAGHWSSYPPHKHDREALPEESSLE
jgi:5-deoxy-glucuronate isomerase